MPPRPTAGAKRAARDGRMDGSDSHARIPRMPAWTRRTAAWESDEQGVRLCRKPTTGLMRSTGISHPGRV